MCTCVEEVGHSTLRYCTILKIFNRRHTHIVMIVVFAFADATHGHQQGGYLVKPGPGLT